MGMIDPILMEIEQESKATRRALERVPQDKLGWTPHPKSYTLGQLALHIAGIPGHIAEAVKGDTFEPRAGASQPKDHAEIMEMFEKSLTKAKEIYRGMDDARLMAPWSATVKGQTIMTIPRIAAIRRIALNHLYHHRGQLVVYLRLLDVPVPSVYGPSADENPFM